MCSVGSMMVGSDSTCSATSMQREIFFKTGVSTTIDCPDHSNESIIAPPAGQRRE